MAEIFATELCTNAGLLGEFQHLLFEVEVAEAVPGCTARRGQRIEVVGAGKFGNFNCVLGRRAADDDCQVIRRAGRRAERLHFFK